MTSGPGTGTCPECGSHQVATWQVRGGIHCQCQLCEHRWQVNPVVGPTSRARSRVSSRRRTLVAVVAAGVVSASAAFGGVAGAGLLIRGSPTAFIPFLSPAPTPSMPAAISQETANPTDPDFQAALAFLTQKGYGLHPEHAWGESDTLHVLVGQRPGAPGGANGERAFYFVGSRSQGTDAPLDSAGIRVVAHTNLSVTLAYDLYATSDPIGHPSLGAATVRFNWDGERVLVSDQLPSGDWAAQASRRATPPEALPSVRPIIFLPGILGSYLGDGNGHETWPRVQDLVGCGILFPDPGCEASVLAGDALSTDGTPQGGSSVDVSDGAPPLGGAIASETGEWCAAFTGCVIPFTHYSHTVHGYDMTAKNAASSGYTIVQPGDAAGLTACAPRCFVAAGYDWRLSATTNAQRLLRVIESVIAATRSDRVDVLAHSQGGLVLNALVHLPASVGKLYRVVTLGTPLLGAPKALSELLYAEPCQFPLDIKIATRCLLDPRVAQSLIENYPGVADLLPSQAYFSAYGVRESPLRDATGGLTYDAAQAAIANALAALSAPAAPRDSSLVDAAARFHSAVDQWAPVDGGVGLLRMIGYDANGGSPNCDPISVCDPTIYVAPNGGTITSVSVPQQGTDAGLGYGDGDGTVPLLSASVYNPATGFDDRGAGRDMYWCGYSHMGLAQATDVWQTAEAYVDGNADYSTDTIGAMCPGGGEGTLAGTGLVTAASAPPSASTPGA